PRAVGQGVAGLGPVGTTPPPQPLRDRRPRAGPRPGDGPAGQRPGRLLSHRDAGSTVATRTAGVSVVGDTMDLVSPIRPDVGFVGRAAEIERLRVLLDAAGDGQPNAV